MSKRVIVAGTLCLDITPVFSGERTGSLGELLTPGMLMRVGAAEIHAGGCVANTGLALKLLGAEVQLIGKVGRDPMGDIIIGIMASHGEAGSLVHGDTTSYTVVLAPPGVDRVFLHHPGANDSFAAADVGDAALRDAALFHFGYPPLMRRMYENDGAELLTLFRCAKAAGAATSLDMAAVDPQGEAAKTDWKALLQQLLPEVDFFVPSAEELCFMLDRPRYETWVARARGGDVTAALDVTKDILPLADELMALGAKVVLIKCGAPGLYYRTADQSTLSTISTRAELDVQAWADKGGFVHSFKPSQVLSATGAGDTSIAAFLASVLMGCTPERCVERAVATGACCVESYDALSGLLPFDKLDARIAAGWQRSTDL